MTERKIFLAALDLPDAAARAAYLERACAGDAALRERVEALFRSHEAAGSFLECPAAAAPDDATAALTPDSAATGTFAPVDPDSTSTPDPATSAQSAATCDRIGALVAGRYTLVEMIGEGGMGSVYLATQSEPVKRQVALKLIKTGMDSKGVLARFDAERQALALMDHPNIARIYDGGVTTSGQPFFVMELVRGVPLTDYCDQKRLSVVARLQLFVAVCQAVQHAHQKGIIHRDLKPGNVLVTEVDGRPTPKVIDFGVAKATEQKLTDQSFSDTGAIVGTPAYMSPEQADPTSMGIDTRTDVYALGVVLYELLTGSPPIDAKQFKRGAILEMLRMVREVEPPRPSTKLSTADALPNIAANRSIEPAKLSKLLQGELDWVVMKALEKDRTRRYDTANGLARDLQRYLADEVVEARPPSRRYRLKKFVKRNKGQVIAAGLVLAAVVAGLGGVVAVQARANRALAAKNDELADEQAKVEERFALAQKAIGTFHTGVSEDVLLQNAEFADLRTKLLREAAAFYADLERLLAGQPDAKSRRLLAAGFDQLGGLTAKIGDKPQALAVHRKALAVRRELAAEPGADADTRLDVARSLRNEGLLLWDTGDAAGALRAYAEQREVAAPLAAAGDRTAQALVAKSHHTTATVLGETGRGAESLAEQKKALALQQALAEAEPAVTEHRQDLAFSHISIGIRHGETGDLPAALAAFEASRVVRQKLVDEFATDARFRSDLAHSLHNIGIAQARMGRLKESLAANREALAHRQQVADANPAVGQFQRDLAFSLGAIGMVLGNMGQVAESLAEQKKTLNVFEKLVAAHPTVPEYRRSLGYTLTTLGRQYQRLGDADAAAATWRRAVAVFQVLADADPTFVDYSRMLATNHDNLGDGLASAGRIEEAVAEYRAAMTIRRKLAAADPRSAVLQAALATSHQSLGYSLRLTGKPADALTEYRTALAIREKLVGANPAAVGTRSDLAFTYHVIGLVLAQTGKPAEAVAEYRKALAVREKLVESNPTRPGYRNDLGYTLDGLGVALERAGQPVEALAVYHQAVSIRQKLAADFPKPPEYGSELGTSHDRIGRLHAAQGRFAEAFAAFALAQTLHQKAAAAYPKFFLRAQADSHTYRGWARVHAGQPKEAATDLRKAVELWAKDLAPDIETRFEKARALALLAKLAADAKSGVTAAEGKLFSDQAVAALADLIKTGWGNRAELKEPDFDTVRDRDDFKKLIAELEAKAPKQAEIAPPPRETK